MMEHLNNKNSNGVIKLGVASVDKDSQCNAVYDVGGVCFCLTSGTHGYAMGYILEISNDERNRNKQTESGS